MRHRRGFTLIEVLIVLVLIAILATIALPILLSSRNSANEKAALAVLRLLNQAQAKFMQDTAADQNGNGVGEAGTFGELSGTVAVRAAAGGGRFLSPTPLSRTYGVVSPLGEVLRGGYYFRVYLPNAAGDGVLEAAGGGAAAGVDADNAESLWCAYAWPRTHGQTGTRTFFVNQHGQLLFTDSPLYTGPAAPLPPGAAFADGGALNSIQGLPATNALGRDGNVWRLVGE